jgi:parallel beta-helix repeat protein
LVKPTSRLICGVDATTPPFALCSGQVLMFLCFPPMPYLLSKATTISTAKSGIHLWRRLRSYLRKNRIYDSRDTGVFGSDTTLRNNRFYKNKYQDVHVRDRGDNVVEVNDLSSNVKRP